MRPNNPSKRLRGRNRSKNTNPLARSYESNGPDVKIRGSAMQVADKYAQLARDAQSSGDRVMAENYLQHAEHYYRIVASAYEQSGQGQPNQQGHGANQRERGEENGRFEDRNFRNEQPTINGYDGVEDEDSGLRRTLRTNGSHAPVAEASTGSDVEAAPPRRPRRNGSANGHDAADEERSEVAVVQPPSDPPVAPDAVADAAEAAEEEKPKRRRATRARPRARRADAEAAPSEANEPTTT